MTDTQQNLISAPESARETIPASNAKNLERVLKQAGVWFQIIWVNRKRLLKINVAVGAVVLLYLIFFAEPYYESSVVVLPDFGSKSSLLGGLSDLASIAGVNLDSGTPTEIFSNLIFSESVLENVIYKKYTTEKYPEPVNLIEYFEIEADDDAGPQLTERSRFLKAYEVLTKARISTSIERLTKILTVTVTMPESKLSADAANTLIESLDDYIRNKRKSFASQQRFYIEKRIAQVKDSLTTAENALRNFRDRNRIVEQSPMLYMDQSRLMRSVEIQQAVFVELTKQLEIARIDEIRDMPVVNFRENAAEPVLKAGPPRIMIFAVLMFLTFVLSSFYIIYKKKIAFYYSLFSGR